ncbi:ATP-dependent DNA helicase RecG [Thioalkalivibrio paradoxus]|uniref:ATP-dependent DNA helicase RecG n=1 Tax=Thioalkalivibrio paradoxus ARh 1 TaxID=713585 RepID=W0DMN7_9GAMM|nr:ATP-dependent DNA helicase RecG [Thioalkalivibrio paradoxus]AHE99696.1 ATP-dependent DNA helicase RecG [Thioalkalivibrio paradoxus ARh 1]
MDLDAPLTALRGVGPKQAERLGRLGLARTHDLLLHLPLRFEDRTRLTPLQALRPGSPALFEGRVEATEVVSGRRRMLLVHLGEGDARILLRFFHFGERQQRAFANGVRLRAYGEIRGMPGLPECVHPEYRILRGPPLPLEPCLTPVYPATEGVSQRLLRELVGAALPEASRLPDLLPELRDRDLPDLAEALEALHRPPPNRSSPAHVPRRSPALTRLVLEELCAHQLALMLHAGSRPRGRAPELRPVGQLWRQVVAELPFTLTGAQQRTIAEIQADLGRQRPMNRLLQGDVGSGKTLVAVAAALTAIEAGHQVAFMAPTELLARQHLHNLAAWLEPLGIGIAWLGGRQRKSERETLLSGLASGERALAVGTHALFQEQVAFARLGLAIIDEQHRFGVHQRMALRDKGTRLLPHQLIMTATPIPRTLAMSLYADLDQSVLDERPPGRTPVKTALISSERRDEVIARIRVACGDGVQAYWVCPLIEDSETLEAEAAETTAERLREALPELRIERVHGRMKPAERDAVMDRFRSGTIDLLVATTVIEVGVDVPNASLMIIENAERMGLSQLHQLRGRVGRGRRTSACVLLYRPPLGEVAQERLEAMRQTDDGFEIAEVDLAIRGPGEMLGTRQTGERGYRVADWGRDQDLMEDATRLARQVLPDRQRTEALIRRWLGSAAHYGGVG